MDWLSPQKERHSSSKLLHLELYLPTWNHTCFTQVGPWFVSVQDLDVYPNSVSFGAAISACEKGGEWQMALGLLQVLLVTSVVLRNGAT